MNLLGSLRQYDTATVVNIAGLAIVYLFLLLLLNPLLLFGGVTTTGGDTGTHHYLAYYMEHFLLSEGQIRGWSPDWYAGFPIFFFYFPLPYILIALFDVVLPYNLSFNLVTVLGPLLLPAVTFWMLKRMAAPNPMPLLGAGAAAAFLAQENYTIYGANLASTLAGEFSFSISFALALVFYGLLTVALSKPWRGDGRVWFVAAAATLAAAALCHAIPAAFAGIAAIGIAWRRWTVCSPTAPRRFIIAFMAVAVGFGLAAFWAIPLLANIGWTADMEWLPKRDLQLLAPLEIAIAVPLVLLGAGWALVRRKPWATFFLFTLVASAALFLLMPTGSIWNTRFLPFYYFSYMILAGTGVYVIRNLLGRLPLLSGSTAPLLVVAIVLVTFYSTRQFIPDWIRWNYQGYEAKEGWTEYKDLNDLIESLPPGRVMWEYTPDNEEYGTPRALEIIPFWTGHPTMEGLLIESSITSPFHFINQAELSVAPTLAVRGIEYPPTNVQRGLDHLRMFNVRYFLARSPEVIAETHNYPGSMLIEVVGKYAIFELETDGYVTVPEYEPVRRDDPEWLDLSLRWYQEPDLFDAPIVWDFMSSEEDRDFLTEELATLNGGLAEAALVKTADPDSEPVVITESIDNDKITFTTNRVGEPHWVKVSYFPNWKATGARGPYLASPSFMMVIPTQENVTLEFQAAAPDRIGATVSILSGLFCLALLVRRRRSLR